MDGHTYVDADKIASTDWSAFDEILLVGMSNEPAIVVYKRLRGSRGGNRRLVIVALNETHEIVKARVRAQARPFLGEDGW